MNWAADRWLDGASGRAEPIALADSCGPWGDRTVTTIRVGVPWLSEQDWPKWTEIDPEMLPYDVWRAKADDAIVELESRGIAPVEIAVGPRAFADWCRISGTLRSG